MIKSAASRARLLRPQVLVPLLTRCMTLVSYITWCFSLFLFKIGIKCYLPHKGIENRKNTMYKTLRTVFGAWCFLYVIVIIIRNKQDCNS